MSEAYNLNSTTYYHDATILQKVLSLFFLLYLSLSLIRSRNLDRISNKLLAPNKPIEL